MHDARLGRKPHSLPQIAIYHPSRDFFSLFSFTGFTCLLLRAGRIFSQSRVVGPDRALPRKAQGPGTRVVYLGGLLFPSQRTGIRTNHPTLSRSKDIIENPRAVPAGGTCRNPLSIILVATLCVPVVVQGPSCKRPTQRRTQIPLTRLKDQSVGVSSHFAKRGLTGSRARQSLVSMEKRKKKKGNCSHLPSLTPSQTCRHRENDNNGVDKDYRTPKGQA